MKVRLVVVLYLIAVAFCIVTFPIGSTYCYFTANLTSKQTVFQAWVSDIWTTSNTTEFNAGVPVNVNTTGNEVKLNRTEAGFSYMYSLTGGGTNNFTRYNISADSWEGRANTLAAIGAGGALVFNGTYIYALAGGGSQNFTRYNPANNTWQGMNNTLAPINAGGALAFDGTYIYALAGGGSQNFTRYNPANNTWQGMANTLAPIVYGGSLAYGHDGYLYATAGGGTNFTRYNISTNTWESRAPVSDTVAEGGGLTYGGGTFLYATAGGVGRGGSNYWRYNITANTWTVNDVLQDSPLPPKAGGALTSDTINFEYAIRGDNSQNFWRYDNTANTWTSLANTLQKIGGGGSLVYVPGAGISCYLSPGSIASIVFNTTTPNSRWDLLAWNASIPSGTNITFEVRASNSLFLPNNTTLPWISVTGSLVGGIYVVSNPSLPSGQYLQWRANLTSTNCSLTPVLYDVTVYYSDWITPPVIVVIPDPLQIITAIESIKVNDPPVAVDDLYTTSEDTVLIVPAPGVLGNDGDVDSVTISTRILTGISHGALSLNPDGSFTYIPDSDFTGTDSFTYVANDTRVDSNVATVAITVTPVHESPCIRIT